MGSIVMLLNLYIRSVGNIVTLSKQTIQRHLLVQIYLHHTPAVMVTAPCIVEHQHFQLLSSQLPSCESNGNLLCVKQRLPNSASHPQAPPAFAPLYCQLFQWLKYALFCSYQFMLYKLCCVTSLALSGVEMKDHGSKESHNNKSK